MAEPSAGVAADAFVREAGARGTLVLGSDAFAVGRANWYRNSIRISLGGGAGSHAQLEQGLKTLAALSLPAKYRYIPG